LKKLLFTLLTAFTLFLQGCGEGEAFSPLTTTTTSATQSSTTSVMLILYSYPTEWEDNSELTSLINATDGEFISVINPSDGPGLTQDSAYVNGLDYLNNQNSKIVAYVYTSYGTRDKQDIYNDIDTYVSFYGTQKISGIFFDEVSLRNSYDETFIKDISSYAKSKNLNFIVLNPGTTVNQEIIDENYYDIILTYEDSYENYLNFNNPLISSTKTKQSIVVYEYPNLVSYANEIQKAKDMHFDYIYLTIDSSDNPWDTVFNFLK
jgi:hypothetical protein